MIPIAIRILAVAIVTSAYGCHPMREPPGLPEGPVCVAYNAEKQEVKCTAAPESYSGDSCTCADSTTGAAFYGRVRGGM
jgi:hypothetical protein